MNETDDTRGRGEDPVLRWLDGPRQTLEYDCQRCGACCANDHGSRPGYVVLTKAETETLWRLGLPVLECEDGCHELGTVPYQGAGAGRVCAAFQGRAGTAEGHSLPAVRDCGRAFHRFLNRAQPHGRDALSRREADGLSRDQARITGSGRQAAAARREAREARFQLNPREIEMV